MYDLTVVGAGWAGFNAAARARDLGLKVALVEKASIGGTCLNRGCIPTKTLIQSAKLYSLVRKSKDFGIDLASLNLNFLKIQERKNKIILQLRSGMKFMLKGIDYFNSEADILTNEELKVANQTIKTKFIIIATGSKPGQLSKLKFDGEKIISSDQILDITEVPHSLMIIGGGVIGCEFASLFSALGCQVSIAEKMPQLLPGIDKELSKKIESVFKKKGIRVSTGIDAESLNLSNYDLTLLSIGRVPSVEGLNLDRVGVKLEKERILVDEHLKTNIPNIYAAGDCTAKIMLAHYAAYQGRIAAGNIANIATPVRANDANIPNCIFTDPEIATIGLSEEDARLKCSDIKINKFFFLASGMAHIIDETEGFIKILSDKKTDEIIGAHIIGPKATELIGILTVAIQSRLKLAQIRETILAHPTLSETITDTLRENHGI